MAKATIPKKVRLTEILWARVQKDNATWISQEMRRRGYKSRSEFLDQLIIAQRNRKPLVNA